MRLKASQTLAQRILQPNQNWRRCVLEWVHTTAVKSRKTHTLGGFLNNIQPQSQLGLSAPRCWEDICRNPMFIQELVSSWLTQKTKKSLDLEVVHFMGSDYPAILAITELTPATVCPFPEAQMPFLRTWFSGGLGRAGLMVGFDDLRGLFYAKCFSGSMICRERVIPPCREGFYF